MARKKKNSAPATPEPSTPTAQQPAPPAGPIDPNNPPPPGSVYVFAVRKGMSHPIEDDIAGEDEVIKLRVVACTHARIDLADVEVPGYGKFHETLADFNEHMAPCITATHGPGGAFDHGPEVGADLIARALTVIERDQTETSDYSIHFLIATLDLLYDDASALFDHLLDAGYVDHRPRGKSGRTQAVILKRPEPAPVVDNAVGVGPDDAADEPLGLRWDLDDLLDAAGGHEKLSKLCMAGAICNGKKAIKVKTIQVDGLWGPVVVTGMVHQGGRVIEADGYVLCDVGEWDEDDDGPIHENYAALLKHFNEDRPIHYSGLLVREGKTQWICREPIDFVPDTDAAPPTPAPAARPLAPRADLAMVFIKDIDATHNVRETLDDDALFQLGESIKDNSLLQPVVVRKLTPDQVKASKARLPLRLVAGHRRLEAARRAGEDMIEAKVYAGPGVDDAWEARARLTENVQRSDLNHIELAKVYGAAKKTGMSVAAIAAEAHRSDDDVRRHLALLRLCEPVRRLVASGRLPVHQAELIARVGDVAKQIDLTESATRLEWDNKAAVWRPHRYGWNHRNQPGSADGLGVQDVDDKDFVLPMKQLRDEVARKMQGLAAVGWPMAEEYAGQRPCEGCPDNTLSYADHPTLFAGIKPQGSAKKGHCTNKACYDIKMKVREKERDAARADREKKQKAAIAKAKKAGLDVCGNCGKIADAGEEFEAVEGLGKRCPKCKTKAENGPAGGGGSYAAQQTRRKELQKKFPWTDEQREAVALFGHMVALGERLVQFVHNAKTDPDDLAAVCVWGTVLVDDAVVPWKTCEAARDGGLVYPPGGDFPAGVLPGLFEAAFGPGNLQHLAPGVGYDAKVGGVPFADAALLDFLEALAAHWGLPDIPERPSAQSIAREGIIAAILAAKKGDLEAVLAGVEDTDLLAGLADGSLLPGKGKKLPKYKQAAIEDMLNRNLRGDGESVPRANTADELDANDRRNRILQGRKKDALAAVAECESVVELTACQSVGLRGDWRRAAVAQRIDALRDDAAGA